MVKFQVWPLPVDEDGAAMDVFDAATGRPLTMEALGCEVPQLAPTCTTSSGLSGRFLVLSNMLIWKYRPECDPAFRVELNRVLGQISETCARHGWDT